MKDKRKVGIIGLGPRGGWALENFILNLIKRNSLSQLQLLLFEETGKFGNGQVYDTEQAESNWINISERILLLDAREAVDLENTTIPSFPSYHEWAWLDFDDLPKTQVDTYPPRAKIGAYLKERFQSLINPLLSLGIVSLREEQVTQVKITDAHKITIHTQGNTYHEIDEVLLTIGHQPTELSRQLQEWRNYATEKENVKLFESPYPIRQFLNDEQIKKTSTIGIRGFGLAMIDVARALANHFGRFSIVDEETQACVYQSSHPLADMLIPFSLDGLPPAPKPLNAQIDEWFEPTKKQLAEFEEKIGNPIVQEAADSPDFLIKAFAGIAASIYTKLPQTYGQGEFSVREIENTVIQWLQDQEYKHPAILPLSPSPFDMMQQFVGMATGKAKISLDFCIGQVWRHCQPSIYQELSFNQCSEKVIAAIIDLDESTKRYSYGPPVASIQQMLALVEAGVMNLALVNDPDFALTEKGWCIKARGKTITADVMINSVLDAPKIKAVDSPVVKNLLADDLIQAVHDDLGVLTDENGYVMSKVKDTKLPLALLGRLAKGTIIGVDAILECFGDRPQKWATEATKRHINSLNSELA